MSTDLDRRVTWKRGRDVATGDVLCYATGDCPRVIFGWREYDPPVGGAGRIGVDGAGVGVVVHDDAMIYVVVAA